MVQKRITNTAIKERMSEPRYELGDILQELGAECNLLAVGVPNGSGTYYRFARLEFPVELLWKQLSSRIIIINEKFIPDLQHHDYLKLRRDEAEFNYRCARVGHVDLSNEDISNSKGRPILHVFPELRRFYNGSGYFQ